jgi:uncharacterized protein
LQLQTNQLIIKFVATIKSCRHGTKPNARETSKTTSWTFGVARQFDSPVVTWEDARENYGELRINLLGWLNGVVVHMTYTERGDEPHIISLRKAEKYEIRRYAKEATGYGR